MQTVKMDITQLTINMMLINLLTLFNKERAYNKALVRTLTTLRFVCAAQL